MRARRWAIALGLAAAIAFAALASVRITAQGPEYDELHQAVGAFTWIGAPPPSAFCLDFHGICVLNTTYSAAIKTHLYGLFLRLSGRRFALADWRWLAILLIAASLPLFAARAYPVLGRREIAIFFALLLTDGSLLLLGRFDWGPVALAFLLRLAMIALWLYGEASDPPRPGNTFALGVLAGLATFEKLSSSLLVLALAAMILGDRRRRSRRHLAAALLGLATGALPLVLVNLGWLAKKGELISVHNLRGGPGFGAPDLVHELLVLGYGGRVRMLTLGLSPTRWVEMGEAALLATLLLLVFYVSLRWRGPGESTLRRAGIALAAFAAVGAGLWLMPRATWAHHWILATPFQYLAIALALRALRWRETSGGKRIAGVTFAVLVTLWLGLRLVALGSLEDALRHDSASQAWDPALAELGQFAACRPPGTLFVATDWGVGTQILCYVNGRPGRVVEPFWDDRGLGVPEIAAVIDGARNLYLVRLRRTTGLFPATARIEREIAADPSWREVLPEAETSGWRALSLRKYVRSAPDDKPTAFQ
ncbi:MAG: hypothetical protein M3547_11180 [Acidobacteriota bacterium]|nr:hypothetical protein [Acidobacteriota bacterium]